MSDRERLTAVVLSFTLLAGLTSCRDSKPVAKDIEPSVRVTPDGKIETSVSRDRIVSIRCRLSTDTASIGEEVVLTEMLPVDQEEAVFGFHHEVQLIADYESERKAFTLRDPERCRAISSGTQSYFSGDEFLAHINLSKPIRRFWFANDAKMKNGAHNGRVLLFKCLKPGIYSIVSVWSLPDEDRELVSTPVILTVEPKQDR